LVHLIRRSPSKSTLFPYTTLFRSRIEVVVGEGVAGCEVACGAERESRLLEPDAGAVGDRVEHLLGLGDDLGADAVAGDDGQLHDTRRRSLHRCTPRTSGGTLPG